MMILRLSLALFIIWIVAFGSPIFIYAPNRWRYNVDKGDWFATLFMIIVAWELVTY